MNSSLKKEVIIGFSLIPNIEQLKGNQLILTTPMGLICGDPADFPNEDPKEISSANDLLAKILSSVKEKHKGDIDGNDGYLAMENVTIHLPGSQPMRLSHLVVFFDQIIGVTIGNMEGNV